MPPLYNTQIPVQSTLTHPVIILKLSNNETRYCHILELLKTLLYVIIGVLFTKKKKKMKKKLSIIALDSTVKKALLLFRVAEPDSKIFLNKGRYE